MCDRDCLLGEQSRGLSTYGSIQIQPVQELHWRNRKLLLRWNARCSRTVPFRFDAAEMARGSCQLRSKTRSMIAESARYGFPNCWSMFNTAVIGAAAYSDSRGTVDVYAYKDKMWRAANHAVCVMTDLLSQTGFESVMLASSRASVQQFWFSAFDWARTEQVQRSRLMEWKIETTR